MGNPNLHAQPVYNPHSGKYSQIVGGISYELIQKLRAWWKSTGGTDADFELDVAVLAATQRYMEHVAERDKTAVNEDF